MGESIDLTYTELMKTGPCSSGCLRVLPLGKSITQKVAVGDQTGVVQCWGLRKMVLDTSFKTMEADPVTSLTLGRTGTFLSVDGGGRDSAPLFFFSRGVGGLEDTPPRPHTHTYPTNALHRHHHTPYLRTIMFFFLFFLLFILQTSKRVESLSLETGSSRDTRRKGNLFFVSPLSCKRVSAGYVYAGTTSTRT